MCTTKKVHLLFSLVLAASLCVMGLLVLYGNVFSIKVAKVIAPYSPESSATTDIVLTFSNPLPDKQQIDRYLTVSPELPDISTYFAGERLVIRSSLPIPQNTTFTVTLSGVPGLQDTVRKVVTPGYEYAATVSSGSLLLHTQNSTTEVDTPFSLVSLQKVEGIPKLLVHMKDEIRGVESLSELDTRSHSFRQFLELHHERVLGYSGYKDNAYMVQIQKQNISDGLVSVGLFSGNSRSGKLPRDFWFQAVFGNTFSFTPEGTGVLGKGERSLLFVPLKDEPADVLYIGKADMLFDITDAGDRILVGNYAGERMALDILSSEAPLQTITELPLSVQHAQFIPGRNAIVFLGNIDPLAGPDEESHLYMLDITTREVTSLLADPLWNEISMDVSADGLHVLLERKHPVEDAVSELWEYSLSEQKATSLERQGSSPVYLY